MTDPRRCEIRITYVGGGPLVIRGRLAWLILKIAEKGAGDLAEDLDRLHNGHLEADWGDNGSVKLKTQRAYHWPGEAP